MGFVISLIISFIIFTFGNLLIGCMMILMGFGGSTGALLFEFGVRTKNTIFQIIGMIFTVFGQTYVIGAFSVVIINLLIWFSNVRPDIPAWPIWIAIYYLSTATPSLAMKETMASSNAQKLSLPITAILSNVIFFILVFRPFLLKHLYGWIPFNYGL